MLFVSTDGMPVMWLMKGRPSQVSRVRGMRPLRTTDTSKVVPPASPTISVVVAAGRRVGLGAERRHARPGIDQMHRRRGDVGGVHHAALRRDDQDATREARVRACARSRPLI